ncbi:unnamed protein product, partial [Didymodactylos carnosus]
QNNVACLTDNLDEDVYGSLHRQLLVRPTRREKQQQQQNTTSSVDPSPMANQNILWQKHYVDNNPQMRNVRLSVNSKSNRNLTQLLVKKKPPKELL